MYPVIQNVCEKMSDYIRRKLKTGQPFNGKELASKYTIDVVAGCIYGIDSESFTSDKCELIEYGSQVLAPSTKVLIYFTAITIFPFLKKIWKVPFCKKNVEDYFIRLLNDAVQFREESKIERNDYLNFILELKKRKIFLMLKWQRTQCHLLSMDLIRQVVLFRMFFIRWQNIEMYN